VSKIPTLKAQDSLCVLSKGICSLLVIRVVSKRGIVGRVRSAILSRSTTKDHESKGESSVPSERIKLHLPAIRGQILDVGSAVHIQHKGGIEEGVFLL